MKKIILCILLLIPILVILTIDASGKLIASALVEIQAENIVLKHEGEELTSAEISLEDYSETGRKYTIFAEIYPGMATSEPVWTSSNTAIATVAESEDRTNACEVTFLDYGSVDITCASSDNASITARATLYIGGKVPGYMTVSDYAGNAAEGKLTIKKYERAALLATVKPANSVLGSKVTWQSDNTAAVTVDDNGVITAVGAGVAVVSASVTAGGKTVSNSVEVTVSGSALFTKSLVYVASDNVDVSDYFVPEYASAIVCEGGNTVDMSGADVWDKITVQASAGSIREALTLVKVDADTQLVINNADMLTGGVLSSFLAIGSSNVTLSAACVNGTAPEIVWTSSNESVVHFMAGQGGRIYAVGSGEAVVTASATGCQSVSIAVKVISAVQDFRLSETEMRDKLGLAQQRVFGNLTYKDGKLTHNLDISVQSVSPAGVGAEAFTFESANTDIARVNANGVITFADDCEGKAVTITATAYDADGNAVRHSYTYHLVNGANIGIDADADFEGTPDFTPYADLKTAIYMAEVKAIVLHCDVYYPSKANGGTSLVNVMVPVFGNGNKLDGQYFMDGVDELADRLLAWDFKQEYTSRGNYTVNITNLNLQATQPTSENSEEAFTFLVKKGGRAITVKNAYQNENPVYINFDHCLFQYAYSHADIANGNVTFNGCIFRNNSATAVVMEQTAYGTTNVTLKNCIFSNTIAPVGMVCGCLDDVVEYITTRKRKEMQWGTFELQGNNYVYNWKKLEDIQMNLIPSLNSSVKNYEAMNALIGTFNNVISKVIKEAFMCSDEAHLYTDSKGEEWLNFGFLIIGIWADLSPQFNPSEHSDEGVNIVYNKSRYTNYEIEAYRAPSVSGLLTISKTIGVDVENFKTYLVHAKNSAGQWNTKPNETYHIDQTVYDRLNGVA